MGAALLLLAYNASDQAKVDDNGKALPDSGRIIELVKQADVHRMILFGAIAAFLGLGGFVGAGFGLRKTSGSTML